MKYAPIQPWVFTDAISHAWVIFSCSWSSWDLSTWHGEQLLEWSWLKNFLKYR